MHFSDTETGPGVYETALAYTSALRMADNAILFKYLAKSVGMQQGVLPSFMAKPWGNVSVTTTLVIHFYITKVATRVQRVNRISSRSYADYSTAQTCPCLLT